MFFALKCKFSVNLIKKIKILILSSGSAIRLINGLFETDYLLKLRKSIETARTPENLEALKSLILNDIIGSISKNLEAGNITQNDAQKLRQLTLMLYRHLYAHYEEMEAVNDMTDESLILDIDIIEEKYETKIQKLDESIQSLMKENQQLRDVIEKLRRETD